MQRVRSDVHFYLTVAGVGFITSSICFPFKNMPINLFIYEKIRALLEVRSGVGVPTGYYILYGPHWCVCTRVCIHIMSVLIRKHTSSFNEFLYGQFFVPLAFVVCCLHVFVSISRFSLFCLVLFDRVCVCSRFCEPVYIFLLYCLLCC